METPTPPGEESELEDDRADLSIIFHSDRLLDFVSKINFAFTRIRISTV